MTAKSVHEARRICQICITRGYPSPTRLPHQVASYAHLALVCGRGNRSTRSGVDAGIEWVLLCAWRSPASCYPYPCNTGPDILSKSIHSSESRCDLNLLRFDSRIVPYPRCYRPRSVFSRRTLAYSNHQQQWMDRHTIPPDGLLLSHHSCNHLVSKAAALPRADESTTHRNSRRAPPTASDDKW